MTTGCTLDLLRRAWLVSICLPVASAAAAQAAPTPGDDPGSGCGVRFVAARPVPIRCPIPREAIDGGSRNGALPLRTLRRPVRVSGGYRIVETYPKSSARSVDIDGVIAEDIQREGIRLKRGGSFDRVALRNLRFVHVPTPNVRPDLPEGIHIESGNDILIENATLRGFQMIGKPNGYWNGDGIATERAASNVTIRNVAVLDNSDAGLDLKSSNNVLDQVYAAGNKRNIRLWSDTRAGTIAIGPVMRRGGGFSSAGLWIEGKAAAPPTVRIDTLIVDMGTGGEPAGVIVVENGPANVRVGRCIVRSYPPGTPFVSASPGSSIDLGQGCPRRAR